MAERSPGFGRVSVIMPTYNSALTVDRAIDSLLAQTYADWHLVVVDDASTDSTVQRITARRRDLEDRITLICSAENRGPGATRNRALAACKGTWVAVLDSDDAWHPDRLSVLLERAALLSADAVCDNLMGYDDHVSRETGPIFSSLPAWLDIASTVAATFAGPYNLGYLKPIVRLALVSQFDLQYDEGLRTGEDLLYLLGLLIQGTRVLCIDLPLYVYTTQVGGASQRLSRSTKSIPCDLQMADRLSRFVDRHDGNLDDGQRRAIEERMSYLRRIAPLAEFRYARLSGRWLDALSLAAGSSVVRSRLWAVLRDKFRLHPR
jgi:succinoglycan biosynthesis protein ExoO